ncbi:MAG TPA: PQQ-binding-like beta-propeller repeat protein [Gemmatimonadales bacterium]|jgi:outer membrane protein assembly factor BamB|nr:PQQ-binding-like beta-propeller repeat protein [Gemmatimonadales bacterium]
MAGLVEDWIYVGAGGHVVALDRTTGAEMWRTRLKAGLVNLACDEHRLYAAAQGQLFCLDPATGAVLWRNPLRRLGLGLVSILPPGGGAASFTSLAQAAREAAGRRAGSGGP